MCKAHYNNLRLLPRWLRTYCFREGFRGRPLRAIAPIIMAVPLPRAFLPSPLRAFLLALFEYDSPLACSKTTFVYLLPPPLFFVVTTEAVE